MVKAVLYAAFLACIFVQMARSDPLRQTEGTPKPPFTIKYPIDENYLIQWTIDEAADIIQFRSSAKTLGWVGLGFNSESGVMDKAELIIAGFELDVNLPTDAPTSPTTPTSPIPEGPPAKQGTADRTKRAISATKDTYVNVFSAECHLITLEIEKSGWHAYSIEEETESGNFTSLILTRNLAVNTANGDIVDFAQQDAFINVLWSYGDSDARPSQHVSSGSFNVNLYTGQAAEASSGPSQSFTL